MSLLRKDTYLEPKYKSEAHTKWANEHILGVEGFWLPPLELALPNSGLYGKAQIEAAELEMRDVSKMTFNSAWLLCFMWGCSELVWQLRNGGVEGGLKETHRSLGTQGDHSVKYFKGHTTWELDGSTPLYLINHTGVYGPTSSPKKQWKFLLLLSGNEWAEICFCVAQSHVGCLGGCLK